MSVASNPGSIKTAEIVLFKMGETFREAGDSVAKHREIGLKAAEIAEARMRISTVPAVNDRSSAYTGPNNPQSM